MNRYSAWSLVCAVFLNAGLLHAESLKITGVFGNSGEQGNTLVKFDKKGGLGIGVIYDSLGSLWSAGASGELVRFAPDGRELAVYPIPPTKGRTARDTIVLFDKVLMLKLDNKIYTLPLDAPAGTKPTLLNVQADRLSFGTYNGSAAASLGTKVFWVNPAGETKELTEAPGIVEDIEVTSAGSVFARINGKMFRLDPGAKETERGPFTVPGERPQWLNGSWFGHSWHGTIRRFNKELEPEPGVVLGGGSGSFIGYVPGNHELNNGSGMAHLGGNTYAVAGQTGTLHILAWQPEAKRFEILRRIAPSRSCQALALDDDGRVWFHGGMWEWTDGPDAPLKHSIPGAGSPEGDSGQGNEPFAAIVFPNNVMIAPSAAKGGAMWCGGPLSEPVSRTKTELVPADAVAAASVTWNKRAAVLLTNATGSGVILTANQSNGKVDKKVVDSMLQVTQPLKSLTSLAAGKGEQLFAAADGNVIEFSPEGDNWKETRRWNSWGQDSASKFGNKINISVSTGRLWVTDSDRNRVLVFDLETGKLVTQVGNTDKKGMDLVSFDVPTTIAARGKRAVVYDSENQRILKLELAE